MDTEPALTANQLRVLDALRAAGLPLGAYAILERLQGEGFRAPLQVYRALEKLIDCGLVHRLESLNAFIVCDHHGGHGQQAAAFAICDSCGVVSEFVEPSIAQQLALWSDDHCFRARRVTIELRGLCENCAESME